MFGTPITSTVVNQAYDTSGNGGRKLVRLSNGWLVTAVQDTLSTGYIYFYKSTDNGLSWSQLCWTNPLSVGASFAIGSYGTNVYCIHRADGGTSLYLTKFDATTVPNSNRGYWATIDSSQTRFGSGCSLECDSSGNLYVTWCSENSAYPNNFNIRFTKSTDGGTTWTKADGTAGVDQITSLYGGGADTNQEPCILVSDGKPIIFHRYGFGDNQSIKCQRWNGSTWVESVIYNSRNYSYTQSKPCAVVAPNGNIHVVWYGYDSTDTTMYNIRYSKSTDNGVTWSAMLKLTSGNTKDQTYPSVTADSNNNIYVMWVGQVDSTGNWYQIRKIVFSSSWGSISNLTANSSASCASVQTCCNYTYFNDPLCIYRDLQAGVIKYRGELLQLSIISPITPTQNAALFPISETPERSA